MKSKKKRKSVLNRFEKIGSFLVALLIVVFSYGYGDHFYSKIFELDPLLIFALGVLFTFLSVFVLAFIHEIGHMLFGLLCGFEFISFRVGNIMLLRKDGKLTITKDSIPGTAGDCRMAPPELVEGKILPFILNLSGGIAFNLLSAVIFAIPVFSRIDAPIFLLFCFVFVIMNLLSAVINISPRADYMPTDGYYVRQILKDKTSLRAIWINMKILEASNKGVRLCDMPDEWFELSDSDLGDGVMLDNYHALACERMCLQHRYDEVTSLIDSTFNAESKLMGVTEISFAVMSFHIATINGNLDKAKTFFENHLEKYDKMMKKDVSYARVKYGYKLITKPECSCVEKQKNHFLAMTEELKKSVYSFMIPDELAYFEEMEAAIKEAQATQNT